MKTSQIIKTLITTIIGIVALFIFTPAQIFAQNLDESARAKELFHASLKIIVDDTIPTFQGDREVTIINPRGMRNQIQFRDGFSKAHGGYRFNFKGTKERQHRGPNGEERPGMGKNEREDQPERKRGGPGRGPGMGQRPQMPNDNLEQTDRPMDRFLALLNSPKPPFEPMLYGRKMAAKKLLESDDHLIYKGPFESNVAGRRANMIQIESRNYTGGSMRIWLDAEKLIPLKTERISHDGNLNYVSEYSSIEFVDDKDFSFTEEPPKPDVRDFIRGSEQGAGRQIPPAFLNPDEIRLVTKMTTPFSFELVSMRRMPTELLPGVHYIFSDGLNTISVFVFDTINFSKKSRSDEFAQKLGENLDSKLPYPVLAIKEKDYFILITSDMDKNDLKKISRMIAVQNVSELKKVRQEMQKQKPPPE